jgi:hypothetical protein
LEALTVTKKHITQDRPEAGIKVLGILQKAYQSLEDRQNKIKVQCCPTLPDILDTTTLLAGSHPLSE